MATIEDLVARDGPECFWCGWWVLPGERTREHLVPASCGGGNGLNLVMACVTCNNARGSIPAGQWMAAVRDAIEDPEGDEHPAITARARLRRRPVRLVAQRKAPVEHARVITPDEGLECTCGKPWPCPRTTPVHRVDGERVAVSGFGVCEWCGQLWPCPPSRGKRPVKHRLAPETCPMGTAATV